MEQTLESIRVSLTNYLEAQDPKTYSLDKDVSTVKEHELTGIARALAEGFNDEPPWDLNDPRWDQSSEAFDILSAGS